MQVQRLPVRVCGIRCAHPRVLSGICKSSLLDLAASLRHDLKVVNNDDDVMMMMIAPAMAGETLWR